MKLYPHQQELLEINPKKWALVWSMGVGKTIGALSIASKNCKTILVICPKGLYKTWEKNIKLFPSSTYQLITKETFRRDHKKLPKYDCVIVDECFIAGTKIKTPSGNKNIEDINIGDSIMSAYGVDIVQNISEKLTNIIYKIILSNGKVLNTTENHPFFTKNRGWVVAKNLTNTDLLMNEYMIYSEYGKTKFMCDLQKADKSWDTPRWTIWPISKNLFNGMQKNSMETDISKNEVEHQFRETSNKILTKNEKKESYVDSWGKRKSHENPKRKRVQNYILSERKWLRITTSTKNITFCIRKWMGGRISSPNKTKDWKWISNKLQDRYFQPKNKNWDRNRWQFTQFIGKENTGQKEGRIFDEIRVENIEIQEQRNTKVFNLSVKNHPSYFAEGILVHNCHHFLGTKSAMMKSLRWYLKTHKIEYRYFLSGTVYRSSPMDIYVLSHLMDRPLDYWKFFNKFFHNVQMGNRMIPMVKKGIEKDVAKIVNSLGNTVKLEDCVDMPKQTFEVEYVELTKEQKTAIENLEDTMPIVRYSKIHQICGGTLKGDEYNPDQIIKSNKTERLIEICHELDKVIIVCRYNKEISALYNRLREEFPGRSIEYINGSTENRQEILDNLNTKEQYILLVNAKCSEGWQLQTCSYMIFFSYDFEFKNKIQMEARLTRIDAPRPTFYLSLITKDTIDEKVYEALDKHLDFHINIYDYKN